MCRGEVHAFSLNRGELRLDHLVEDTVALEPDDEVSRRREAGLIEATRQPC